MSALKTYTPLRYPGGKNKLSNYVKNLILTNNLAGCSYIEPYAGGAAVALNLLCNNVVSNIVINDFDRSIYAFWYCVLNRTEDLCNLINDTEINIENWHLQKKCQQNKDNEDILALGFSTLFLNRTNYSGIIKAGVIGGLEQKGSYKMDCRFNKDNLIAKIRHLGALQNRITLYNMDTIDLITTVLPNMNNDNFIFFDPPYYDKGSKLYVNYYNHDDHKQLSDAIREINNAHWIVTYDNVDAISDMYREYNTVTYNISYTAEKKYVGQEIMVYSNNLITQDNVKII